MGSLGQALLIVIQLQFFKASYTLCQTSADCSLAGACVAGSCHCDDGFKGESCSVLNLAPAAGNSRALYAGDRSTWGGSVIGINGTYYMYTAQMMNGCGLNSWECNSACVVATARAIEGPYQIHEKIVGEFCHNPTAHIAPDGSILVFHIGTGQPHDNIPPMQCHSGNGTTDVPTSAICKKPAVEMGGIPILSDGAFPNGYWNPGDDVEPPNIAYSTTGPRGPFAPLGSPASNNAWAMNNPAVLFFPNGSLLVVAKFGCNSTISPDPATFCRQFGVYFGVSWRGPYTFKRMIEVFGEDPYLFRTSHGIHMIADLRHYVPGTPSFAPGLNAIHHAYSPNGYDWTIANTTSAVDGPGGVIPCRDGTNASYTRRERPQILMMPTVDAITSDQTSQRNGKLQKRLDPDTPRPVALFNGAALGNTHAYADDHTLTVVQPFA
eukprot:m.516375 g.516375  ORF g.516375 m.516375 type:complete len:436 (-) comp21927_c4_seq5:565-1872(-)